MSFDDLSMQLMQSGQAACLLEADAPKVGNVNRLYDYSDCLLEDFHISAVLLGQMLAEVPYHSVGRSILKGIQLTRQAVPTNTNLGILLLLVPLAKAWSIMSMQKREEEKKEYLKTRKDLRNILGQVLEGLTVDDSRYTYAGIRLAQPSGLGKISDYDVGTQDDPEITLFEVMVLSAERDLIALQYVTGFKLLFEEVLPTLEEELFNGLRGMEGIAQAGLNLLSKHNDSLIFRKHGLSIAEGVREQAKKALELGGWYTPNGRSNIQELDAWLRGHSPRLNPGTTADLIAAALFILFLEQGPALWTRIRLKT